MINVISSYRPTTTWDHTYVSPVEHLRWQVGHSMNRLGNLLCKLGDRITGDEPMGLEESYRVGYAIGQHKPGETIDFDEVYNAKATYR